jgi:hypothetical protein
MNQTKSETNREGRLFLFAVRSLHAPVAKPVRIFGRQFFLLQPVSQNQVTNTFLKRYSTVNNLLGVSPSPDIGSSTVHESEQVGVGRI